MTAPREDRRLLVLYDADCGICSRFASVLRHIDRSRQLQLLPLQAAARIADAPPQDVLLSAMHVRDSDGHWSVGGAACISIAAAVPILRPLATVARIPAISALVEFTYARVAANRHRISRLLGGDSCAVPTRTR